jgi:precorrin-2 dehydrogenase/sirohydrochlorin ferrochelatase
VAERKVRSLLSAGADVTVISPQLTEALRERAARGEIVVRARQYQNGDLEGFFLAYAATDDEDLHARIAEEAARCGVLLNVIDRPQWCTFIVPSVVERGDLTVAVSTAGGSPALARRVRREIGSWLGPEYEQALCVLSRLRRRLRSAELSAAERQRVFTGLVESDLLSLLRSKNSAAVDRLLAQHVGGGVSLASLGVSLDEHS